ncbi:MAG: phosphocholine cytidylyltransferase family protein [Candidatus Omnitrophota bacterium]|jgi:choline kinase
MKAIIIAAGKGKRLKHYSENLPKCLLPVGDKSILEWQIETLKSFDIREISIVKGYQADKINFPGFRYYLNERYEFNNILNSLMCAKAEVCGEVLISYSDILYGRRVVERLLASPHDIAVVTDVDWKEQYVGRVDHPLSEAETVLLGEGDRLLEIGKRMRRKAEANGEFIGMIKLSARGAETFTRCYEQARERFWGKPFVAADTFENAYLTDMLQFLIDEGETLYGVPIEGGWREIDTVADYEKACRDLGAQPALFEGRS